MRSLRLRRWLILGFAAVCAAVFARFVDLTPPVESDFFFLSDDPELQADRRIDELFPSYEQVILAVRGDIQSLRYGTRIHALSLSLRKLEGVDSVTDIRHGPDDLEDAFESPFWRRLLIDKENRSTNLIVSLRNTEDDPIISAIEEVAARYDAPDFEIAISGVPYVVHQIQLHLARDLRVFSLAALVIFTVLLAVLVGFGQVLVGAVAAALTASMLTLILLQAADIEAGVLIANTAIIVFIMALSHIRFLIAEWQGVRPHDGDQRTAVSQTLCRLWWPSFWTMVTTILGFLSLYLTTAKPLRQFGLSSAIGAVIALACAYLVFPPFLSEKQSPLPRKRLRPLPSTEVRGSREWGWGPTSIEKSREGRVRGRQRWAPIDAWIRQQLARRHYWATGVAVVLCLAMLPGLFRLETDPSLVTYFDEGGTLREGLERIDRSGGSSPLEFVVRGASGSLLDDDDVYERLWGLQKALERDPAVGTVLSLPIIMAEADRAPLSFLLSWDDLLERLEDPKHDRIGRSFVTKDRRHARFILRMREVDREEPRAVIVARLEDVIHRHNFVPALTGGLYQLQGQLAQQVASSVVRGILWLLGLFLVISYIVSRSIYVSVAMVANLAVVSIGVYGLAGYFRIPLDIISAAAADLAIAVSIDDMIHLVSHARRHWGETPRDWPRWVETRTALWQPIVASSILISAGFGLFLLSSLPPTQRLGLFVLVGTLLWIFLVLLVFPVVVTVGTRRSNAVHHPQAA